MKITHVAFCENEFPHIGLASTLHSFHQWMVVNWLNCKESLLTPCCRRVIWPNRPPACWLMRSGAGLLQIVCQELLQTQTTQSESLKWLCVHTLEVIRIWDFNTFSGSIRQFSQLYLSSSEIHRSVYTHLPSRVVGGLELIPAGQDRQPCTVSTQLT